MAKEFLEELLQRSSQKQKKVFTFYNCPNFLKFTSILCSYTTNYNNIERNRFSISNIGRGNIPLSLPPLPAFMGTADGKPCRGKIAPHLQETALLFCSIIASYTYGDQRSRFSMPISIPKNKDFLLLISCLLWYLYQLL